MNIPPTHPIVSLSRTAAHSDQRPASGVSLSPRHHRHQCRTGIAMVELMIASAITVIVMTAVMGTFTVTSQSLRAISNYGQIHADGRIAVDRFSKDFRKAIDISNFGTSSVTLIVPTSYSVVGGLNGTFSVRYYQSGSNFFRHNLTSGEVTRLATDVTTATFTMYDRVGQVTSSLVNSKGIQLELKLKRHVLGTVQTEDYLSARLVMRNKP